MTRNRTTRILALGTLLLWAGCSRAGKSSEEQALPQDTSAAATQPDTARVQSPRATPHIDALVPDSARVGRFSVVEILIRGSGFAPGTPGRNTVDVGPIKLNMVPANAAGTEIRFVIPDRYATNNEAPPRPVAAGTFPVTVETSSGRSNAVSIRILP